MFRLEGTRFAQAQIIGLLGGQFAELDANLVQMQSRHLFIEVLGQGIDFFLILTLLGP